MFNSINLGKYYPIESKIHSMNSTAKIISILLFLIMTFIINNIWLFIILLLFTMYLIKKTQVPVKLFINAIKNLRVLIIFLLIFNLLIFNFDIIITMIIILKIIIIIFITSILTFSTPPTEITYGLEKVFKPLKKIKVPVSSIALSLTLALRFIPSIIEQAEKILKSQASRGIDFKNSRINGKIMALSSMLIPMFILSFKRADDLADAMEVRLYNYSENRTNYRLNAWTRYDTKVVIIISIMLLLFIVSEVVFL